MNKEEIKNEFINCIEGSHTLNLAISILEDREELQQENKKYKEVIDKAIEELKKGINELDTRRREEVYIEQYIEQAIDILKEVK